VLENLKVERLKAAGAEGQAQVAVHYYNPDDEREIKGVSDQKEANLIYQQQDPGKEPEKEEELKQEERKF